MSDLLTDFEDHRSPTARKKAIGKIADLLERNGIDVNDIGSVQKLNLWQGFLKDADGEPQVVDMAGITLSPKWAEGPAWPVVAPAKPCVVRAPKLSTAKRLGGFKRAMVLPDIQIGYFVDGRGNLHPTHDEAALDVALQLVRFIRPDRIDLVGDNGDFPELSKYRLAPTFVRTTQGTVDRMALFVAQLRAAAGDECEIRWLEGNHEARLSNYIMDNARAAFGLRVGNQPESWPVLSIPNLCRLDEHGVEYIPGYPANETWINDRLRVIHGHQVTSNGSTAHKYLANERVSTVFGHIHRREWAERTRRTRSGSRTILALSPGCLCRTDGRVPSTKGGVDLDGVPIPSTEDWQQGVAVFTYEEGDGRFVPEQVPILNGWTVYGGREFAATPPPAAA